MAITLSVSLITALMCLACSGNDMLIGFLGEGYGEYGGVYKSILVMPIVLLTVFVFYMSYTVISNIFEASANKRIIELGVLKCVGGTKKQIRDTVIYEGIWLGIIGIPTGLLVGTGIGYAVVRIVGHYIEDIRELSKSIIMRPVDLQLNYKISGWIYVISAIVSLVMILMSAGKPAKKVSKYTALNCVEGIETINELKKEKAGGRFCAGLFGTEGEIAIRNISRNQSAFKAMIKALALGLALLILTAGLATQSNDIEQWMTPNSNEMMVDYISVLDYTVDEITGKEEEKIKVPISADTYNEITKRLSAYGDTKIYGVGRDACTYNTRLEDNYMTEQMSDIPEIYNEYGEAETSLIVLDDDFYKELCDRAGAPYGSNLLINSYEYNNNGEITALVPFDEKFTNITLVNAHDEERTLEVGGFLYEEDLPEEAFNEPFPDPVRIVVPGIEARYFDWYCTPEDEQEYAEYAREVLDEFYPILTEDSYEEQGYTVRISRVDSMVKVLNVAIVIGEILLYGFALLMIMMGITAVISTIASNIRVRGREFAVLKSIGMTNKSVRKMIYIESAICIAKAFVPGNLIGIAVPMCINLLIRNAFPVRYHIPWTVIITGSLVLALVVMLITCIEIGKMKDKSIISEIRMNTM